MKIDEVHIQPLSRSPLTVPLSSLESGDLFRALNCEEGEIYYTLKVAGEVRALHIASGCFALIYPNDPVFPLCGRAVLTLYTAPGE